MFKSPLGEVVKETIYFASKYKARVSIPSRGSGKGDQDQAVQEKEVTLKFQSPLGEVVKETVVNLVREKSYVIKFQSPLGEVVKETLAFLFLQVGDDEGFQSPLGEVVKETSSILRGKDNEWCKVSIPSRGSGKGD